MTDKPFFVHESSYVDEGVVIGAGTRIWHFSHIQKGAKIGKNCSLGQNVNIGNNVQIGDQVKIQNNVSVYEGVTLEDYVFCGPSCVFTNILDPRSEFPQRGSEFNQKTLVRKGATIGANVTIVCGVTIGKYAFLAAGSLVSRDVPDFALVMGHPAVIRGWRCVCGKKLELSPDSLSEDKAVCRHCSRAYRKTGQAVDQLTGGGHAVY